MIFFDIDETLLDFKGAEYLAVTTFYKKFADLILHSKDEFYENWSKVGKKHFTNYLNGHLTFDQQKAERVREIFGMYHISLNDDQALDYFRIYSRSFEDSWRSFDDVIPCLEQLKGTRLGIVSNGDEEQQIMKLKKMGLLGYFEVVITAGKIGIAKPNPAIFVYACEKAKVEPTNCFYVGDDLHADILSCEKIGMKGIWLNRKKRSHGQNHVTEIHSLDEIKDRILLV